MNTPTEMIEYFYQSNLIEDVTDPDEIPKSEKAWYYLQNTDILTKQTLLDIHTLVMTDLMYDPADVGRFRTRNVQVGKHICPPHYVVEELLVDWLLNMRYWPGIDPITCHVQYERIHPFMDGNGRTGRLLLWWHEDKQGKVPTLITYKKRSEYYKLFNSTSI